MMHKTRFWQIVEVRDAMELAEKLTQYTWCGCNGFGLGDYLLLNDSTGADGAQEYAILRRDTLEQVESVTFGWMEEGEVFDYLKGLLYGTAELCEPFWHARPKQIQTPEEHGMCYLCM